jgi:hypothetical protein
VHDRLRAGRLDHHPAAERRGGHPRQGVEAGEVAAVVQVGRGGEHLQRGEPGRHLAADEARHDLRGVEEARLGGGLVAAQGGLRGSSPEGQRRQQHREHEPDQMDP